ncbi:hypothetical protein HGM15179_008951 [Zosterops borbonicus]|uniref:Uncharacterized protein n=1 Tax=Zosterops borbonicus TaxID=364589 RepID=A0A8K1LL25_9PASS|nr:hypothetical protein HGM15179_008951 [Zosterops borbonicus]
MQVLHLGRNNPQCQHKLGYLEQLCREGPGAAGETQGDHEQTECPCGLEGQWDTGDIRKSMASRSGKDPAPLPCSVKALNKLSMRIANIPISWVSCEALSSPDTAGEDMDALLACAQNALDMLRLKRSVYGFSVKKFEHLELTGSDQGNMKGRERGDIKSEYVMKIAATRQNIKGEIACDYRRKMD